MCLLISCGSSATGRSFTASDTVGPFIEQNSWRSGEFHSFVLLTSSFLYFACCRSLYHDTHWTFSPAPEVEEYYPKYVEDCSEEPEILQVFRTALHSETFNLFPSSGKAQQTSGLGLIPNSQGASLFHSSNDPTCTGVGAFVIEKSICAAFLAGHFHGQSCDPTWNSCDLDSSTSSFFKESQHSNKSFFFF